MQDVDCGRFSEQASDYIENTLSSEQAGQMARHLGECADCRRDETALRTLYREMSRLPAVEPPLFFRENVIAAIEREQKHRPVSWWNAPAQWNRLTRTAVGTALASGIGFAFLWSVLLPRTTSDLPTRTAQVLGTGSTPGASLPTDTIPHLHLSRVLTMSGVSGPAYNVQVWLTNASEGTARFRFGNDPREYRFNLREDQARPLQVPLSVASGKSVLSLTVFWSAGGQSHTRHWFVPVGDKMAARNTIAARQSFGLPALTVVDAAREIAERFATPITLDDVPDARVQINARQETASETLTRHLEPLDLAAETGPDGIVIAPRAIVAAPTTPRP